METNFRAGDRVILKSDVGSKNPVVMTVDIVSHATNKIELIYSKDGDIINVFAQPESLVLYQG